MALYISAARRRRRAAAVALVAALIALGVGWLAGRQQVPSIDDRVTEVQRDAGSIAAGIERLDIEYEQTLGGDSDPVETSVVAPLDELRTQLQHTLDRAPWVTAAQRSSLLDAIAAARQDALDKVDLDRFRASIDDAGTAVRTTLGASD
jgi:hypothetical protein